MAEKVTLAQIAEIAGCSVNAVSRALRDKPDISEETRIKIKEIAEKMGYVANYSAQALRQIPLLLLCPICLILHMQFWLTKLSYV